MVAGCVYVGYCDKGWPVDGYSFAWLTRGEDPYLSIVVSPVALLAGGHVGVGSPSQGERLWLVVAYHEGEDTILIC